MAAPPPYARGKSPSSPSSPDPPDWKNKANQLLRFLIVEHAALPRVHADQSNSEWRIAKGRSCRLSWFEDLLYALSVEAEVAILISRQLLLSLYRLFCPINVIVIFSLSFLLAWPKEASLWQQNCIDRAAFTVNELLAFQHG